MENNDNEPKEENTFDFQLFKSILMASPKTEDEEYLNIFQRIGRHIKYFGEMKTQQKIVEQLDQANLYEEFKKVENSKMNGYDIVANFVAIGSMLLFRRWINRLIYIASMYYLRMEVMEPYLVEYRFRIAATQNTMFGQEVRNLYRFYYGDNEITKQMAQQCMIYNETQRLRKEVYKNRI